jgi:hypothetical protein
MVGDSKGGDVARAAKHWKFEFSSVLPIIALGLSIVSFFYSQKASNDVARIDVIKTEYGLFHDLAQLQLQNPSMAHLFAQTNEIYDDNVARIKATLTSVTDQDRAKMLLQERAVAHFLFTTYEEVYLLWKQAVEAKEPQREEMARQDLIYFNEAIRGNPRLLWYWDFRGGKLAQAFGTELNDYYRENVLKNGQTDQDATGPFGSEEETR